MKAKTKARLCWLVAWTSMACVAFVPIAVMLLFWGRIEGSLARIFVTLGIMLPFGLISVATSYYAAGFYIQAEKESGHDEARSLEWLPEWMDKDEARKSLLLHYERRIPLLDRVLAKETTFEAAIRPLLEENLKIEKGSHHRGICNSEDFDTLAASTGKEMKDVLRLGILTHRENPRGAFFSIGGVWIGAAMCCAMFWILDSLVAPERTPLPLLFTVISGAVGAICTACVLFIEPAHHRKWRKEEAQKILKQAQHLDQVVKDHRAEEERKAYNRERGWDS